MATDYKNMILPNLLAYGVWTVKTPFTVKDNIFYKCTAIATFDDLLAKGIDIYTKYYKANNISETIYQSDLTKGAMLVTITADSGEVIDIPTTYILKFPNSSNIIYVRKILSIDLGALREDIDLTYLQQVLAQDTSDVLGIEPTVVVHVIDSPDNGVVTPDQDKINEATRQSKIKSRTTVYADLQKAKASLAEALATNQAYITYMESKGVWPPTPTPSN